MLGYVFDIMSSGPPFIILCGSFHNFVAKVLYFHNFLFYFISIHQTSPSRMCII